MLSQLSWNQGLKPPKLLVGILRITWEWKIFQQSSYRSTHCLITLSKAFKENGSWDNLACHCIIYGHAVLNYPKRQQLGLCKWLLVMNSTNLLKNISWQGFLKFGYEMDESTPFSLFFSICCPPFSFSAPLLLHLGSSQRTHMYFLFIT